MRTLTSIVSVLFLSLSLGCGGGDGDGGGGDVDANTGTGIDASSTVQIDAGASGTGAEALGQICGTVACPDGYTCAAFDENATEGMCILPCTMSGMVDVCGPANGFPGPGIGSCVLADANGNNSCGIACGAQNAGDTSCPTGLICDGRLGGDLCLPAAPGGV